MREIKFRGWNQYWGCFHYATMSQLLDKDIGPDICELSNYSENPEVEQFTGLHDKNGREIYEGDILKTNEAGWIAKCLYNYDGFFLEDKRGGFSNRPEWEKCEVLGNIHENPELLA